MKGGYVHRKARGKKLTSTEKKRAKTRRASKLLNNIQSLKRRTRRR
jgi:hypothetical protein